MTNPYQKRISVNYFITDGDDFKEQDSSDLRAIINEQAQIELVKKLCVMLAEAGEPIWHLGDGCGGEVIRLLYWTFHNYGLETSNTMIAGTNFKRKPVKPELRLEIYERDNYCCQECSSNHDLTIDHIIPVVKGGTNNPSNLQTLCRSCNSRKGTK